MSQRRAVTIALALAITLVAAACRLEPGEHDPDGTAPIGNLEVLWAQGQSVRIIGWTLDPDVAQPINVMVSANGRETAYTANLGRPDVGAAYPRHGSDHGFDILTESLPPGNHEVCVWAVNVAHGERDRTLGCRNVNIISGTPIGTFDALRQVGQNKIHVAGWAKDPQADSIDVTIDVSGRKHRVPAANFRHDVAAVHGTSGNSGFAVDLDAPTGTQRVCVVANNVGDGTDRELGCHTLNVNDDPRIVAGGSLSSADAVGPPAGHPLTDIERDAGISVRLGDGTLFWLFGDSLAFDGNGNLRYFVNNTAALATSAEPHVTRDAVRDGWLPHTFVSPASNIDCPAGFAPAMWPTAADKVSSSGGVDRILAFFANVCLSSNGSRILTRGIALVEWNYQLGSFTPNAPAALSGRVLNQHLFSAETPYGSAALAADGSLYAYFCGRPADDLPVEQRMPDSPGYSGCRVARANPTEAQNLSAWRYWNGGDHSDSGSWSSTPTNVTMQMPGSGADRQQPPAAFTIANDPVHGLVFVNSMWPGYTDTLAVRKAATPVGPWSGVVPVSLPGCVQWVNGVNKYCYAGTAQPWRSVGGPRPQLGIGYFDQFAAQNPTRGSYVVGSVPSN